MNATARAAMEASELTEVTGGAVVETSVPGAKGFRVLPSTPDAGVFALRLDADWEPPTEEAARACRDGTSEAGPSKPVHVEWALPVTHATFSITTERPLEGVPGTTNWFRWTDRCEAKTLAGEVHNFEDVKLVREPLPGEDCEKLTQLWTNVSVRAATTLQLRGVNCDNEEVSRRVEIDALPHQFWIKTPVPPDHWIADLGRAMGNDVPGTLFKTSETIDRLSYTENGCLQLIEEDLDPTSGTEQLVGKDEAAEGAGRKLGCAGDRKAAETGEVIVSGFDRIRRFTVKVSDGSKHYVDGVWTEVTDSLEERWDLDGFGGQRDMASFERLIGSFDGHRLEVRNTQDDRGVILDLTQFASRDGLTVDFQGQWYGGSATSPAETLVTGSIHLPSWVDFSPRCLDWDFDEDGNRFCDRWETTREVQERLARQYFKDKGLFADGRWQTIPPEAWAGALS